MSIRLDFRARQASAEVSLWLLAVRVQDSCVHARRFPPAVRHSGGRLREQAAAGLTADEEMDADVRPAASASRAIRPRGRRVGRARAAAGVCVPGRARAGSGERLRRQRRGRDHNLFGGRRPVWGYALLWVVLASMVALSVTQEVGARLGLATGRGLLDLVREGFGIRWAALAIGEDADCL
jgi:hypothetical protein